MIEQIDYLPEIIDYTNNIQSHIEILSDNRIYLATQERADIETKLKDYITGMVDKLKTIQNLRNVKSLLETAQHIDLISAFAEYQSLLNPSLSALPNTLSIKSHECFLEIYMQSLASLLRIGNLNTPQYTLQSSIFGIVISGVTEHLRSSWEYRVLDYLTMHHSGYISVELDSCRLSLPVSL